MSVENRVANPDDLYSARRAQQEAVRHQDHIDVPTQIEVAGAYFGPRFEDGRQLWFTIEDDNSLTGIAVVCGNIRYVVEPLSGQLCRLTKESNGSELLEVVDIGATGGKEDFTEQELERYFKLLSDQE